MAMARQLMVNGDEVNREGLRKWMLGQIMLCGNSGSGDGSRLLGEKKKED